MFSYGLKTKKVLLYRQLRSLKTLAQHTWVKFYIQKTQAYIQGSSQLLEIILIILIIRREYS